MTKKLDLLELLVFKRIKKVTKNFS